MTESYIPPNLDSLADVDLANVDYNVEPIVIEGLVSPSSQGASVHDDDGFNVHMFSLAAWQQPNGPIVENKLLVLRPVSQDHDWGPDFPPVSTHRLKLLLSKERNRSVLVSSEPIATSSQFQRIAEKFQRPVVVEVEQLGKLILDRSLNWFEGETIWNGETVRVSIPADEDETPGNALATAKVLWSSQSTWRTRIEQYAVNELLDLKNDTWLQEGETSFSRDQFIEKLELESIQILPDGEFEFWFDDGDLFWGHSIMVSGDTENGPDDAGIHG